METFLCFLVVRGLDSGADKSACTSAGSSCVNSHNCRVAGGVVGGVVNSPAHNLTVVATPSLSNPYKVDLLVQWERPTSTGEHRQEHGEHRQEHGEHRQEHGEEDEKHH